MEKVAENVPEKVTEKMAEKAAGSMNGSARKLRQILQTGESPGGNYARATSAASSLNDKRGKELRENMSIKLYAMKWVGASFVINIITMVAVLKFASQEGLSVSTGGSLFETAGPALVQILMHFCHEVTQLALRDGLAAYLGSLLASKKGYSLAVCGFAQAGIFSKFNFASNLSYRSPSKKLIAKLSYIWLIHFLVLILTVFSSTSVTSRSFHFDSGALSCVIYGQSGPIHDRGWPVLETEMGVAEYIFGTSLGHMRSEESVDSSTFVLSPQLIDTAADGSTIIGPGFLTTISTSCNCSSGVSTADLIRGGISLSTVARLKIELDKLSLAPGMANSLSLNGSIIQITSLIPGANVCAGSNVTNPSIPICVTTLSDHKHATILMKYMTDGTPASIAPQAIEIRSVLGAADMSWVMASLQNMLGGDVTHAQLPSTYPGSVNPLLWWSTSNQQAINTAALTEGLETTWAMILRGSFQRSFSTRGEYCVQNIVSPTIRILNMSQTGAVCGWIFLAMQLLFSCIALVAFIPWILSKDPIKPAVRLISDKNYLTVLISTSSTAGLFVEINGNTETALIWSRLDSVVRVGESIATIEDADYGSITMDKPKLVAKLDWLKKYV